MLKTILLISSIITSGLLMSLKNNRTNADCSQKYSTVALVNTEMHPNVIGVWRNAMYGNTRVITEYDYLNEYHVIELRAKGAESSSKEVEEKVYIFSNDFDESIIEDTCEYPITKILTFSRNIPNNLFDLATDTAIIKDITDEH